MDLPVVVRKMTTNGIRTHALNNQIDCYFIFCPESASIISLHSTTGDKIYTCVQESRQSQEPETYNESVSGLRFNQFIFYLCSNFATDFVNFLFRSGDISLGAAHQLLE